MTKNIIEFVFNPPVIDKISVLEKIAHQMRMYGLDTCLNTGYGQFELNDYTEIMKEKGDWRYFFESIEIEVLHGYSGAYGFYHIYVREKVSGAFRNALGWVAVFLSEDCFLSARIADSEYEYWQNADRIWEYERAGRSYERKELVSNNLPPPLSEIIIDTSINPGRRILRSGFIEAIGYEMWLSARFFELIGGCSKAALQTAGWRVDELENGILHLSVAPSELSEEGHFNKQKALRAALFGCEQSK